MFPGDDDALRENLAKIQYYEWCQVWQLTVHLKAFASVDNVCSYFLGSQQFHLNR